MVDANQPEDKNPNPTPPEGEPKGRSAEDRIHELLSKNKELEDRLNGVEVKLSAPPPPPARPVIEADENVKKGVDILKKVGDIPDRNELVALETRLRDQMTLDSEHARLENLFDGEDGKPAYDRTEINKYMREKGVWNPEIAYKALHEQELLDFSMKKLEKDRQKKPYVAKPSSAPPENREQREVTKEKIDEALNNPTPENRAWYEANRQSILELYGKGQL